MQNCINDPEKTFNGTEASPKGHGYSSSGEDVGVIKKELTPEGLIIYMVEDRMKGDSEDVSEEDRLSIIQESRRSNLQLIFNDLREKYKFDETISISNQFANQNS